MTKTKIALAAALVLGAATTAFAEDSSRRLLFFLSFARPKFAHECCVASWLPCAR
jgi:hypothetical protein